MSIQPLILLTPILLVKLCWKWLPDCAISHWYSSASWNIHSHTKVRPFKSFVGGQRRLEGCHLGFWAVLPQTWLLEFLIMLEKGWEHTTARWSLVTRFFLGDKSAVTTSGGQSTGAQQPPLLRLFWVCLTCSVPRQVPNAQESHGELPTRAEPKEPTTCSWAAQCTSRGPPVWWGQAAGAAPMGPTAYCSLEQNIVGGGVDLKWSVKNEKHLSVECSWWDAPAFRVISL